ncbi:MAG: hypothetical protein ACI837_001335 [Crocinitomicaceae bacterium]|jgi:hypothetical protein
MQRKQILALTLLVVIVLIIVEPAFAGPGGYVAKGLFKTWWGKILLFALLLIFLPLILYIKFREHIAVRKNTKSLSKLGLVNKDFSWLNLEKNVRNVYSRVHVAWEDENMENVSRYVSSWYWQNQQLVVLDKWKDENLKNICRLQEIGKIKPLHLEITDHEALEGSRIAFSITGNIEDFLVERTTGKIVYGRRGYQEEEKIWILEYTDGQWLLDDIREGNLSLAFAKMSNSIPVNLPKPIQTNPSTK